MTPTHDTASLSSDAPTLDRTAQNAVASVENNCSSDHVILWKWTARIVFNMYELGCGFFVLLFLGEVPGNPHDWMTVPNRIGTRYAYVSTETGERAKCRAQLDIKYHCFVHLDHALARHSGLGSSDPEVVAPYLKKALKWRILKINGEPAMLQSLEVSVFRTPLTFPPGSILPVPGRLQ